LRVVRFAVEGILLMTVQAIVFLPAYLFLGRLNAVVLVTGEIVMIVLLLVSSVTLLPGAFRAEGSDAQKFLPAIVHFLLILTCTILAAEKLNDYVSASTGQMVGPISPDAVAVTEDADRFVFSTSHVATAYTGIHKIRSKYGNVSSVDYAAPVVGEGWTKEQPVHVWAVCSTYTCEWDIPHSGGYRIRSGLQEPFRDAISDSINRFHIVSTENSILIRWADPVSAVKDDLEFLRNLTLIFPALWIVCVLFWAWRTRSA